MTDHTDHSEDEHVAGVEDGAGCVEVWRHLSDERRDDQLDDRSDEDSVGEGVREAVEASSLSVEQVVEAFRTGSEDTDDEEARGE